MMKQTDTIILYSCNTTNNNFKLGFTCRPPITRSNINGIIAKKSTRFIGCLKNLHFLGEHTNLTIYSIRKNRTIAFSEKEEYY